MTPARLAAAFALCCATAACADVALPAAPHPRPHPEPVTQLAVAVSTPVPVIGSRPRSVRIFICHWGSPSSKPMAAFMVDGWMMPHSDFHRLRLDPADIREVSVAKGPDAVLRYGEAARDGIVIITTRSAASR